MHAVGAENLNVDLIERAQTKVQAEIVDVAHAHPPGPVGLDPYTKYNDGKSGYPAQSALPLYFGLGEAAKIDRVEVDWPSGKKQVVSTGLSENQTIQITEPK